MLGDLSELDHVMKQRRLEGKSSRREVFSSDRVTEARRVLDHGVEDGVCVDVDDGCGRELVGEESQLSFEEAVVEHNSFIEGPRASVLIEVRSRVRELREHQW